MCFDHGHQLGVSLIHNSQGGFIGEQSAENECDYERNNYWNNECKDKEEILWALEEFLSEKDTYTSQVH